MTEDDRPTAAVVVIGNEVLAGKVVEQNAAFLIRRFRELGVRLVRVEFIPDDPADISATVARVAALADVVCTTGGVGPTHDDVTIEAVAAAFGVPTRHDATLLALVERYFGEQTTHAHRRLALIPEGATLVGGKGPPWPTIQFHNVYILPGIPKLMAAKFEALAHRFVGRELFAGAVEITGQEADICDALDAIVASHPDAEIGSYPRREQGGWMIRLTVESLSEETAARAVHALESVLADRVVRVEPQHTTRRP
ncbi:MAG: competence/damage-inducible protein A [Deltaproteobacteria bacterium]|nr:competence/damage-inducible protein A [Deltaproteobacteria bacterium]